MGDRMSLGQFISQRRKRMYLTQEELASRLNVSKSAIAKWETDGGLPDRDNLRKLSEVMGVSVDDLHRVIDSANYQDIDFEVNITPEVIATLEAYGYIVIRPGEKRDENGD